MRALAVTPIVQPAHAVDSHGTTLRTDTVLYCTANNAALTGASAGEQGDALHEEVR
jgi:hypothetical protein